MQADKLRAEIKADDEKHGKKLDLTCFEIMPLPGQVVVKLHVEKDIFVAKTEVPRVARFFNILAERYGV